MFDAAAFVYPADFAIQPGDDRCAPPPNIDGDVLFAAEELAKQERKIAGKLLSDLMREALRARADSPGEARARRSLYGFKPIPAGRLRRYQRTPGRASRRIGWLIGAERGLARHCHSFVDSEVPEIWEDDVASASFADSLFDSLAYASSAPAASRSAKLILDSLALSRVTAEDVRTALENALGEEDWYEANFGSPEGRHPVTLAIIQGTQRHRLAWHGGGDADHLRLLGHRG